MNVEVTKPLRIAFMGTPDFAVTSLQALIDSTHDVVCVYSQPPRPKGRGKKVQPSPVHQLADEHNIEVRTPQNFKQADDVNAFDDLNLDVAIVAAYGLILPKEILDAPQYGCINIHASLLPRWRGAAPIHRAIWSGDEKTGVTLMQMDEGLDTGDMISKKSVSITPQTTLSVLHDELADLGAQMIVPCLHDLSHNQRLETVPQSEEGMSYASMLKKQDGRIDWQKNAIEIDRQIRGLNPWPGTWSLDEHGKRVKIIQVKVLEENTDIPAGTILEDGKISCGQKTVLQLEIVQPENKKSMNIGDVLNGGYLKQGSIFS